MLIFGIVSGFAAAFFQSCGYIFSRIYIKKGGGAFELTILAQLIIGALSVPLLFFAWRDGFWGDWRWVWPLLGVAAGATGGELMFFRAERHIAPSRLSALFGLRVVMLAIVMASFGVERYNILQIAGIVLAAASAGVMNYQDGKFNFRGMGYVGGALIFYCLSDFSIKFLIDGVDGGSLWRSILIAICLLNLLIATVLLPFLWIRSIPAQKFVPAAPYAGAWFVKQLFLYSSYAAVGPVFGNVIMASRGPLSIALTLVLLHFGVKNLETPKGAGVWIRRGIATMMMIAAIALYSLA